MKVVHLSYSDMGGAGVAAKRLHQGLLANGMDSHLLTLVRLGEEIPNHSVWQPAKKNIFTRLSATLYAFASRIFPFLRGDLRQYYLKGQKKGFDRFSFPYSANDLASHPLIQQADIVHLHWVADGMLDFMTFFGKIKKPVVWTLHDMNPFTGGCHHSDDCMEFMLSCVNCEQVKGTVDEYIAMRNLAYKLRSLETNHPNLTIITPSHWLGSLSVKSRLFKSFPHHVIPNLSNEKLFTPGDKAALRKLSNIPADAFVVLFVANDVNNPRKGMNQLLEALSVCNVPNMFIVTAGNPIDAKSVNMPLKQFGFITSEEQMREMYAMADVFVLPSLAENFPNTIVEAHLCGTPVIANNVGGIPEQINEKNGILVTPGNATELAAAIERVSRSGYDQNIIRQEAMIRYSSTEILNRHIEIYRQLA